MIRFLSRLIKLMLASGLLAGVIFLSSDSFARSWREFVIQQLAERGLNIDFERLTLNPVGGLVAREVQIYREPERRRLLAAVDRLNLDFDLGKLLEQKVILEELELSHANLTLPPDADAADQSPIELKDLSARAFLTEGRLEVRQAEGMLSGIHLSITGDLILPAKQEDKPDNPEEPTAMERIQLLSEHQQQVQKGVEWLHRFKFESPPRVTLEVHAVADRPLETNARLFFEARGLGYEGYRCKELLAEAEFNGGVIDLKRFLLRDDTGEVLARATWQMGAEDLRFHLNSSANLPGLAQAFLNSDNLREIVFYEPPHLALDGVWHVAGPLSDHKRPVHVTGRLECGRFSTRGAVFNGLTANMGVAPEGVYVRDALLKHETGTLAAQVLVHETEGTRYRATLQMDPTAFMPFAEKEQTRQILRRFQFNQGSDIFLELEGTGSDSEPRVFSTTGRGRIKRFIYRGVGVDEISADVAFVGAEQHYRNVRVARPEGTGTAEHVHIDDKNKWVRLSGITSKMDPVAVVSAFAAPVAEHLQRYRLPNTTEASIEGVIHYKDPEQNDFRVHFEHPRGSATYPLWGEMYLISAPEGDLKFKGRDLDFDIRGEVYDAKLSAKGRVDLTPNAGQYAVVVKAERFPYLVFSKKLPFEKVTAEVKAKDDAATFIVQSTLLGGSFSLQGTADTQRAPNRYRGELRVEDVSFERFAELYSKNNDTEGDLTGHFKFSGVMNDWAALRGEGVAIILNGNLYSVPILGPLTPLLGTILPRQIKGYNIAKEANCTFEVANGFVTTKDLEALTSTFRIVAGGTIDFIRDDLDFSAQVRMRGLPGLVFLPFSELLEYHADGSVMNPSWRPKILKGTAQRAGRPDADDEAEARSPAEAQREEAPEPSSPRRITPLFRRSGAK